MSRIAKILLVPALVAFSAADSFATVLTIDDFSTANGGPGSVRLSFLSAGLSSSGSTLSSTSALGPGLLSAGRQTSVRLDAALVEPDVDDVVVTIAPSRRFLDYASSVGADGSLRLTYRSTVPGFPPVPIDLSGVDAFNITFLAYDAPSNQPLPVRVFLNTGGLTGVTPSGFLAGVGELSGSSSYPATLTVPIDPDVRPFFSSTLDITVEFLAVQAADFRISNISVAVPEPTSALLPLAVAGFALRRTRRA